MNNKDLPAFPVGKDHDLVRYMDGLSKREYIAAMCLQGILSNNATRGNNETIAKTAVIMADELLTQLNETQGNNE